MFAFTVSSMGTEDRQAAQYIPPMLDRVHPVVVFTVNDILDLAIEPTAPPVAQTLPDDPAIRQSVSISFHLDCIPFSPYTSSTVVVFSMMKYFSDVKCLRAAVRERKTHVDASVAFLLSLPNDDSFAYLPVHEDISRTAADILPWACRVYRLRWLPPIRLPHPNNRNSSSTRSHHLPFNRLDPHHHLNSLRTRRLLHPERTPTTSRP